MVTVGGKELTGMATTDWEDAPAFDAELVEAIGGPEEVVSVTRAEPPEETALAVVRETAPIDANHVIVGLGTLAKLPQWEFEQAMEMLRLGRERVAVIQKTLMKEGTDYGKVKGIDRPFLHLPGAEVLEKVYGFASEQRTFRLLGDGVSSPPYAYRTDTYVHLGDLSGPIVAVVSGACNPWEEKYRYRWAKAKCPNCGREGLIRGRKDGPLKGQWWCPGKEGGCNQKFEPGVIPPPERVQNDDIWALDETIIQMSQKRSYVAAIRRATGTSGLFTIDEDSPSVREQAQQSDDTPAAPQIGPGPQVTVKPGAKGDKPTKEQLDRLVATAKDKDLGAEKLAALIERLFGVEVEPVGKAVSDAVKRLSAEQVGAMLLAIETGEVPAAAPAQGAA